MSNDHVTTPGTLLTVTSFRRPPFTPPTQLLARIPVVATLPGRPFKTVAYSTPFLILEDLATSTTLLLDTRWVDTAIVSKEYTDLYLKHIPESHTQFLESFQRTASAAASPPIGWPEPSQEDHGPGDQNDLHTPPPGW